MIYFWKKQIPSEKGEPLNFQDIETACSNFKACPKCNSKEGYWLGSAHNHIYIQCKCCGTNFNLFEFYPMKNKTATAEGHNFLRKYFP
jgi:hypothetical protein